MWTLSYDLQTFVPHLQGQHEIKNSYLKYLQYKFECFFLLSETFPTKSFKRTMNNKVELT